MNAEVKVSLAEVVLLPGEGAALEWQECPQQQQPVCELRRRGLDIEHCNQLPGCIGSAVLNRSAQAPH